MDKRRTAAALIALGNQLEREYVSSMVNTVQTVLFEQPAGEGLAEGYTGEYVRVRAPAQPGSLIPVRIVRAEDTLAVGEPTTVNGR